MADKMQELILNDDLQEQMRKSAQAYAIKSFLLERCVSEIQTIYDEVNV